MKRIVILLFLLLLVGCLPTPDRAIAEHTVNRQDWQADAVPISDAVLIPMDEAALAALDNCGSLPDGMKIDHDQGH